MMFFGNLKKAFDDMKEAESKRQLERLAKDQQELERLKALNLVKEEHDKVKQALAVERKKRGGFF